MKKSIETKVDELRNTLSKINEREEGIFSLSLVYDEEFKGFAILDDYEEFYYGGFAFDRIYEELNNLVKSLFGKNCYLDCICPGKWVIGD